MKGGYVSLEEAHPPIKRVTEMQVASAMLRAVDAALEKGPVTIPVPDSLRTHVLARKKRHPFAPLARARAFYPGETNYPGKKERL